MQPLRIHLRFEPDRNLTIICRCSKTRLLPFGIFIEGYPDPQAVRGIDIITLAVDHTVDFKGRSVKCIDFICTVNPGRRQLIGHYCFGKACLRNLNRGNPLDLIPVVGLMCFADFDLAALRLHANTFAAAIGGVGQSDSIPCQVNLLLINLGFITEHIPIRLGVIRNGIGP